MSVKDRLFAMVVSSGGLGYAPVASGTFGTLGGVAVVLAVRPLLGDFHFGMAMIVLSLIGLAVGVALGDWAERHYRKKDPGHFVLDELVGYWITLFRWDDGMPGTTELVVAFFVFRFFDVLKPPPGRRIEHWPKGWGIMLDDVVAGVYSMAVMWGLRYLLEWP